MTLNTATISAISKASPASITATAHGFSNNEVTTLTDIGGMVELNDNWYVITVIDVNTITVPVDSTSFTTYTSGGEVKKATYSLNEDIEDLLRYDDSSSDVTTDHITAAKLNKIREETYNKIYGRLYKAFTPADIAISNLPQSNLIRDAEARIAEGYYLLALYGRDVDKAEFALNLIKMGWADMTDILQGDAGIFDSAGDLINPISKGTTTSLYDSSHILPSDLRHEGISADITDMDGRTPTDDLTQLD